MDSNLGTRTIHLTIHLDESGRCTVQQPGGGSSESLASFERTASTTAASRTAPAKPKPKKPKAPVMEIDFDDDYDARPGFDVNFLDPDHKSPKFRVHVPTLSKGLERSAVELLQPKKGNKTVLHYFNMSVVINARRRFGIYSAANIDFGNRYRLPRTQDVWRFDPRIPMEAQIGNDAYEGNQFDRGHLTRREDLEFGAKETIALQSAADTCHWTNCFTQHKIFNRQEDWWQGLEQHILERSVRSGAFSAQVFTGPILSERDPVFPELPGVQIPMRFWKVAVARTAEGGLFAAAFIMSQSKVIRERGLQEAAEIPFAPYKRMQLPIDELQQLTGLTFTCGEPGVPLKKFDPLKNRKLPRDEDQDGKDDALESTSSEEPTPEGWVNLETRSPILEG